MIAKTLLNLDRVVYTLEPAFDPNAVIRRYASEILQHRLIKAFEPGNMMTSLIDLKDFVERLPSRVNKILDAVGNNDLQIKVDALDEKVLMEGAQKIANRITLGVVIAAMIIGAAMLMRVETAFKIFGYPGLAMISFLLAAAAGFYLVVVILFYDQPLKKRTHHDED
jgi:hypothetical protein